MGKFPRRRHAAAVLLLTMMVSSSLTVATPALASGSASAAAAGWAFYATYPSHASCTAAANTNSQGRKWQCVVSARSGEFDLYFWS
jgi:hypothetical protein